jgi:hypothetical protein
VQQGEVLQRVAWKNISITIVKKQK